MSGNAICTKRTDAELMQEKMVGGIFICKLFDGFIHEKYLRNKIGRVCGYTSQKKFFHYKKKLDRCHYCIHYRGDFPKR